MQYIATIQDMKKRAPISATEHVSPAARERGQRMLDARRAAGLTQNAVARKLSIEKSTVYRWEKGISSPRDDIERVAKLYGSPEAWLMYGVGDETAPESTEPYEAWSDFEGWLEHAPESRLVEPWMLEEMRSIRLSDGRTPTLESYKRLLFVMFSIREAR